MNHSDMPYPGTPGDTSQTTNRPCDLPGLSEAFLQNTLICLAILDLDFNFIQVSQSYANASQKKMKDFPGHNIFDVHASNKAQSIFEEVRRLKISHMALCHPFIFPDHPERGVTYWNWTLEPIVDASGTISYFVLLLHDATNLKQIEHTLVNIERDTQQAMQLLDATRDGLFIFEAETLRFSYVNQGAIQQTGYSRDELLRMTPLDLKPNFGPMTFRSLLEPLALGRLPVLSFETLHQHKDGHLVPVEINLQCVSLTGESSRFIAVVRDITERKQMESQLLHSEERFRRLIEVSSQLVWEADARGLRCGDFTSWEKFTGHAQEESTGWRWLNAVHPEDRTRVSETWRETIKKPAPCQFEVRVRHHHQGYRDTICHAAPLFNADGTVREWIGMHIDITARKQAEDRLRHTSKLEAIGKLAGGIAHDFNNLLTVIRGYNETMLRSVDSIDPLYVPLREVSVATARAAALTQQLLAFSRQQVIQPHKLQLNRVIAGLITMLQRLIGEHIHLVTSLDPNLDLITIDPAQIEQVIVNLVVNARDAMPNGGTLTIETANTLSVSKGPSVRLAVRDTGIGMDDTMLSHIFEPFYTTKPVGHGTGLGLAVVYGIVSQNGGRIHVRSRLNQGSTFIIKFPSTAVETTETDIPPKPVEELAASKGETILLSEDDEGVRRYLSHALSAYDYHILEAASPDEALQQAIRSPQGIQLLVTDMVMPGMNGEQLAARILDINPAIKVLVISGYMGTMNGPRDPAGHPIHFLEKPFPPNTIAHMVRHILDEETHPASDDCLSRIRPS